MHQVEVKKTSGGFSNQHMKSSADFMPPGTELSLDPADRADTKSQLEPTDEIEQIDLTEGKSLNIGKAVQGKARDELISFLRDNQSVFAWSAADMPGIPRHIAEHKLFIRPGAKPVRQKKCNMGEERQMAVKRVLIDTESSADILYLPHFRKWRYNKTCCVK